MTWTLNGTLASALGVSDLLLEKHNQAADLLTFRVTGDYVADLPFAARAAVTLARDGAVVFRGTVTRIARAAAPNDEAIEVTVSGPWWQLENTIFMQRRKIRQAKPGDSGVPDYLGGAPLPDWLIGSFDLLNKFYSDLARQFGNGWSNTDEGDVEYAAINAAIYNWLVANNPTGVDPAQLALLSPATLEEFIEEFTPRAVLGQQLDNTAIDTATQIAEIVGYAAAAGAPVVLGGAPGGVFPPFTEVNCVTCAQAITTLLRWTPDAVTWFDYAADPPVLRIDRRAASPVTTLALHDGVQVSGNRLIPRHDLLRDGVVIIYTRGHDLVAVDSAPAGANPQQVNVAVMCIELASGSSFFANYHVDYAPINIDSLDWWKSKIPKLADAKDLKISDAQKPGTFNREVVGGSFPPGINGARTGTITCKATYSLKNDEGAETKYENVPLTVTLNGTNFVQEDWTIQTGGTAPEPVPQGLAAELWAGLVELQHDGTITLSEEEANPGAWRPGQLLNLTGGRAEWAGARAQLQSVSFALASGQTTLTLGPGPLLRVEDLVELVRAARQRALSSFASLRVGGGGGGGGVSTGGKTANTANSDSEAFITRRVMVAKDDAGVTTKLTQDVGTGELTLEENTAYGHKVTIKLADLGEDAEPIEVKLREVNICEDGVQKSAYVLMSEPKQSRSPTG
ncbi:MAG: hypothetical protein LBK76_06150 [Verrucomicrobiales bacterium]|jgi:hypothetical protein|nr:hypothetical protein [Verrucomicrobiales bacterium]